jgi:glyoxylase-like metal-dependent hydrolase (beta-lactamase superfamily II)
MGATTLKALEGNTQKLDGGAMFGNAPRAMWAKWAPPDEANRILLACRSLLVRAADGRVVLFEAGIGAFFEPKMRERFGVVESRHILLESLAEVGLSDADVDAVVLSHLHFDHAGGLLSEWKEGEASRLLFPRARFYVGSDHWVRAKNPHPRDRASFVPELNRLLESSGRLTLVESDGQSDLSPLVTFRFSNGHTPGLMLSEIATPEGPLVFASDLIPGAAWVHVPLSMGYDRFPELVIDEKRELLEDLVARGGRLFFTHDPASPCGRVHKDASGRFSADFAPLAL